MTQPDPEAPWGRDKRSGKPLLSPEERKERQRAAGYKGGTNRAKKFSKEEMAKQVADGRAAAAKIPTLSDEPVARARTLAQAAAKRTRDRRKQEKEEAREADSYVIKSRGWGKPLDDDDFQRTRKKKEE